MLSIGLILEPSSTFLINNKVRYCNIVNIQAIELHYAFSCPAIAKIDTISLCDHIYSIWREAHLVNSAQFAQVIASKII